MADGSAGRREVNLLREAVQPAVGFTGALKELVRRAGHRVGATEVIGRLKKGRAHVLMYHKVERRPRTLWGRPALDTETFAEHLQYLTRHFEILPLSQLAEGVRKGKLPDRAVSITFDDGYRNNLLLAFPLLRRHRVPATVFITAGLVGTRQWMWTSELSEMALRYGVAEVGSASGDRVLAAIGDVELPPALKVEMIIEHLMRSGRRRRLELLERLRQSFPIEPDDENAFLSWDEVRALHAGGVEIGSHTMTHPVLTEIPATEVERELSHSRNVIADHIGASPTLFAYPHGTYSPRVKQLTGRYYGAAVTTRAGENRAGTDSLELRRVAAFKVEDLAFELARPRT